ncbi:hypothetical protein HMPREF1321_1524 [Capnocytophaga sp. oral taxon 412 str. F0487]|uniref:hypothetical protein n=1 Tax=Capnocytophaga sp. oral taxon 412 TaxID=712218 RepID=UPI0002696D85|nr:hypothetical protein HMPREF1321_1524 [Capnocytophaga sp. oral taxon 412 str. F0487]
MFLLGITKKGYNFFITDTIWQSNALPLHRETKKQIIITKTFLNNPKAYFRED